MKLKDIIYKLLIGCVEIELVKNGETVCTTSNWRFVPLSDKPTEFQVIYNDFGDCINIFYLDLEVEASFVGLNIVDHPSKDKFTLIFKRLEIINPVIFSMEFYKEQQYKR